MKEFILVMINHHLHISKINSLDFKMAAPVFPDSSNQMNRKLCSVLLNIVL